MAAVEAALMPPPPKPQPQANRQVAHATSTQAETLRADSLADPRVSMLNGMLTSGTLSRAAYDEQMTSITSTAGAAAAATAGATAAAADAMEDGEIEQEPPPAVKGFYEKPGMLCFQYSTDVPTADRVDIEPSKILIEYHRHAAELPEQLPELPTDGFSEHRASRGPFRAAMHYDACQVFASLCSTIQVEDINGGIAELQGYTLEHGQP